MTLVHGRFIVAFQRVGQEVRLYRYPLNFRCSCNAKIRIITGCNFTQLDWTCIGEHIAQHNKNSHAEDKSKFLPGWNMSILLQWMMQSQMHQIYLLQHSAAIYKLKTIPDLKQVLMWFTVLDTGWNNRENSSHQPFYRAIQSTNLLDCSMDFRTNSQRLYYRRFIDQHIYPEHEFYLDMFEPIAIAADIQAREYRASQHHLSLVFYLMHSDRFKL